MQENKSIFLPIKGKTKSLMLNLTTKELLLVPNSDTGKYCSNRHETNNVYNQYIQQINSYKVITAWLFLTLSCDLACSYCFESGTRHNKTVLMSTETIDEICLRLKNLSDNTTRKYEFVYFGGEPLLNYSGIVYAIKKFNEELNGSVIHKVITNGLSLSFDRAVELIKLGVGVFQITLDGNKEIHDSRRFTVSRKGTFDIILNNIKKLLSIPNNFTLIIRMNVDKSNNKSIKELLNKELNIFKDHRVYIDIGKVCSHTFKENYPNLMSRAEFSLFYEEMIGEIFSMGLKAVPPYSGGCSRRNTSSLFFSPKGKIFQCPARVTDSNCQENSLCYDREHSYPGIVERCKECELLLLCGGGCDLSEDFSKEPICEKKYIRKDLRSYYEAKYSELLTE